MMAMLGSKNILVKNVVLTQLVNCERCFIDEVNL